MQIDLKPEDVDELVKQTILKAGIGKLIQDTVAKVLSPHNYDNPIDKALKTHIVTVVEELLKTDFKDKVDAAVREALEAALNKDVAAVLAAGTIDNIVKAARDRY